MSAKQQTVTTHILDANGKVVTTVKFRTPLMGYRDILQANPFAVGTILREEGRRREVTDFKVRSTGGYLEFDVAWKDVGRDYRKKKGE